MPSVAGDRVTFAAAPDATGLLIQPSWTPTTGTGADAVAVCVLACAGDWGMPAPNITSEASVTAHAAAACHGRSRRRFSSPCRRVARVLMEYLPLP
jgi:hypothetical protein